MGTMDKETLLDLRKQGLSYNEIAQKLGTSKSSVCRMFKKIKKDDVYKVIVLPDPHIPRHHKPSIRALNNFLRENTFDEWLCLGDLNDFEFLYKLDKTYLKTIEEHTFKHQYKQTNKFLDEQQELILRNNKYAKFTLLEGNHDVRPNSYMEAEPSTAGFLGVKRCLHLEERNIRYIEHWSQGEVYSIGAANFIHGYSINKYHAFKAVQDFGTNIFYGHTHDIQSHTIHRLNHYDSIVGQSFGTLMEYNAPYMRGKPHKWQHAFGLFYFFDDGYFTYQVITIIDGAFVGPNGKIYRG